MNNEVTNMARKVWGTRTILPFPELDQFAELVAAREREECTKLFKSLKIPEKKRILEIAGQVGAVKNICANGRHDGILFTEYELQQFVAAIVKEQNAATRSEKVYEGEPSHWMPLPTPPVEAVQNITGVK